MLGDDVVASPRVEGLESTNPDRPIRALEREALGGCAQQFFNWVALQRVVRRPKGELLPGVVEA